MKYQIREMLKQDGGAIVNTASAAGVTGIRGCGPYCASKFGLVGLSGATALDYASSNIRVNVVAPGLIETPMLERYTEGNAERRQAAIDTTPLGRAGYPEGIAATVLWLCSELGAFTVGATLVVDGGQIS